MPVSALPEITEAQIGSGPINIGDPPEREVAVQQRLQIAGLYKQLTATAAGATAAIEVSRIWPITIQTNGGQSVNRAQWQGSIDNSNWTNLVGGAVSGNSVVLSNISGAWRYLRGNVDTYSSGTITFDLFGLGK